MKLSDQLIAINQVISNDAASSLKLFSILIISIILLVSGIVMMISDTNWVKTLATQTIVSDLNTHSYKNKSSYYYTVTLQFKNLSGAKFTTTLKKSFETEKKATWEHNGDQFRLGSEVLLWYWKSNPQKNHRKNPESQGLVFFLSALILFGLFCFQWWYFIKKYELEDQRD